MKILKFSYALFAAFAIFAAFLTGCNSDTTENPDTPRVVIGEFKYTGATYAPIHFNRPYFYAIYDINGRFVAYADTSKIITARMDKYMGKLVEVRGPIVKVDGETVMRIEALRIWK